MNILTFEINFFIAHCRPKLNVSFLLTLWPSILNEITKFFLFFNSIDSLNFLGIYAVETLNQKMTNDVL